MPPGGRQDLQKMHLKLALKAEMSYLQELFKNHFTHHVKIAAAEQTRRKV